MDPMSAMLPMFILSSMSSSMPTVSGPMAPFAAIAQINSQSELVKSMLQGNKVEAGIKLMQLGQSMHETLNKRFDTGGDLANLELTEKQSMHTRIDGDLAWLRGLING